jgi:peptidoglycan/xylan/chitin deacetylase (PgdA/CDA1 family)
LDSWLSLRLGDFAAQVAYLRRYYEIVSLDEALQSPAGGNRPRAVLTFDDGEWGMHQYLLPIVRAESLPVTVYVATGQIENGQPYWFDRVMNALQVAEPTTVDLTPAGLSRWVVTSVPGKTRWHVVGEILEALKGVDPDVRETLADQIVAHAKTVANDFEPLRPMKPDELRELAAEPLVTIGAHSHGHELLDQIAPDSARSSIARSRELLERWTGQPVRHFAYPNGNFSPALMALLNELGFASATTLSERLAGPDAPAMALPRIGVGRYDGLARWRLKLVEI